MREKCPNTEFFWFAFGHFSCNEFSRKFSLIILFGNRKCSVFKENKKGILAKNGLIKFVYYVAQLFLDLTTKSGRYPYPHSTSIKIQFIKSNCRTS